MIVCIAEKPSVALEIAKVIGARSRRDGYYEGNGYQVTWTFGHLCCLKAPDEYNSDWKKWSLATLPMIPSCYGIKLIDNPGVKKQFKVIKSLYAKAQKIVNCGDAGQEGELIQRWVMQMADVKCPVERLWISSLTEESIREGFKTLRPQKDYDSLFMAGQARSFGDWLLGMNATRLYTLKYGQYRQILSIGRVQTPTLAMIVDRDKQIENFKPEPYWLLTTKYRGITFSSSRGRLDNEGDGQHLINIIQGKPFTVTDIQKKDGLEFTPQLYDLTSLQVDCNKKYSMSAEQTLKNIQSLYEKKLTTYPRVDTKFLTEDIYAKCPLILFNLKGYENLTQSLRKVTLKKSSRVFDNSKVTDHHAIIPTGEKPDTLTDSERKVYDLICRRFIAIFYPDCRFFTTTVTGKSETVLFKVSGKTIIDYGWKKIYLKDTPSDEENNSDEKEQVLPVFSVGETGNHFPQLSQKMTTPPKRYTEASLLQSMETAGKFVDDENLKELMKENGIGRPSSRAGIIETLLNRGYIKRDKRSLISTQIGRDLISVITNKLLKSPKLTGQWEKKLRDIENGKYKLNTFMSELELQLKIIIDDVNNDSSCKKIGINS